MKSFEVSVIIPVFNAEDFIERAIKSATNIDCVKEVIIIDDGSSDQSINICKYLASNNTKIRLLFHKNNKNLGVSASRNLGISQAKSTFISFLDADDYYLPNRFDSEKRLFDKYSDFDGAYGATKIVNTVTGVSELYTLSQSLDPELLFNALIWQNYGLFHISTLTIKKELLKRVGYFDEKMRVAEDTELFYRIAASGRIYSGNITNPVSLRIIHNSNTIIKLKSEYPYYLKYLHNKMLNNYLFKSYFTFNNKNEIILMLNHFKLIFEKLLDDKKFIIKLCLSHPKLLICPFIYHRLILFIMHKTK